MTPVKNITIEMFNKYCKQVFGDNWFSTYETNEGFYVISSYIYVRDFKREKFSQSCGFIDNDNIKYRLSKTDLFNDSITNGFFNKL